MSADASLSSDLVNRLRAYAAQLDESVAIARHTVVHHGAEMLREAADELERLRTQLRAELQWRQDNSND